MAKEKRSRTVKKKGKCSCGMRLRSLSNLSRHAQARGHRIDIMPVTPAGSKMKKSVFISARME